MSFHRLPRLPVATAAVLFALGAALLAAPSEAAPPEAFPGVRAADAFPGVTFTYPVWVGNDGTSDFVYVGEQAGVVYRLPKNRTGGPSAQPTVFLDLSSKVVVKGQAGLAAVAFHPTFAQSGRFFVSYVATAPGGYKIVLSELRAQGDRADAASEKVLLEIPKSRQNHNGGGILFGPDGKLWMGTGDNVLETEAQKTSAAPDSLLGKILRIDVDAPAGGKPYGIPADNPWPSVQGVRPEIWAYGFRNPWRFCFDDQGAIWVASPGRETKEWVHKGVKAANHGWPFFEGTIAFQPLPPARANEKIEPPVWEYTRQPGESQTAIVGGVFYAGDRVKTLKGKYICADYGRSEVYVVDLKGDKSMRLAGQVPSPSSIGTDRENEVYITTFVEGGKVAKVFTLVP